MLAELVERAGSGLVPGADLTALLDDPRTPLLLQVMAQLEVFPSGDGARLLLAGRSTDEIAFLVGTVPGLAGRLADAGTTDPPDAASLRALSAQDLRRMALLHPNLVGPVDGAPVEARYLANRVLITGARDDLIVELGRYTLQDRAYGGLPSHARSTSDLRPADPEAVARAEGRLALFTDLLTQPVRNYDRDPGEPAAILRQVLLFDAAGDGRIAEVLGDLDQDTRNAAVLVPGTGADLDHHGGQFRRINDLREQLPPETAMISWMGSDLPDDIARDAPFARYADEGAGALRDFVAGVVTVAPGAVTTTIGHSYGGAVVGAAEREGLRTDRVLHLASAGASVDAESDYPYKSDRYAMMTPDDKIRFVQGIPGDGRIGHDGSPPQLFTRLETGAVAGGRAREGAPMTSGHDGYFTRESDAFDNILGVIAGTSVSLHEDPPTIYVASHGGLPLVVKGRHPATTGDYQPRTQQVPQ